MTVRPRPTSPHLSVYRFTLTMTMSIVHRITGGANYVGTLFLVAWLLAAAIGGDAYALMQAFFGFWLGQLDPLRLHLVAVPPHARRHPPFRLGQRQRPRPSRSASGWSGANLVGSILLTLARLVALRVVQMTGHVDQRTIATPTTHYGSPKAATRHFKHAAPDRRAQHRCSSPSSSGSS